LTVGEATEPEPPRSLLDVIPDEDSGAQTQDRYRWQHHCTVVDCIQMLNDSEIEKIICEVHEDYIIVRRTHIELVSCKHREPSRGPWSLSDLCLNGGIAHLFSRWAAAKDPIARLITNAALKPGLMEAGEIVSACARVAESGSFEAKDLEAREALARALLSARRQKKYHEIPETEKPTGRRSQWPPVEPGFLERVGTFMQALRVKFDAPARKYIEAVQQIATHDALAALGHPSEAHPKCYHAALSLVASRNMADELPGNYLAWITGNTDDGPRGSQRALIQARTIERRDVETALRQAYRIDEKIAHDPFKVQRLQAKLIAGQVGGTRISSALRHRDLWLEKATSLRTGAPNESSARQLLEVKVLDIAGDVETALYGAEERWGNDMYEGLRSQLVEQHEALSKILPLTSDDLLGLAMDLASRCYVWFSPPFDVDAAIREVSMEAG
jgi:hypothetical protein